jgi:hypothetical protein
LQLLFLDSNQLDALPECLSNLNNLDRLSLNSNTRLTHLPRGIKAHDLNIGGCTRLSHLPDDLDVWRLDLADTGITILPATARVNQFFWRGAPIFERTAFSPEIITHYEVFAEKNLTTRRVLIERMGIERFMREAKPEVLDLDQDAGGERQLLRIELRSDEPVVCLSVIDPSTGRQYMLRVPPTMTTCRQAAAWIAGFDNPDDYKPLVET